MADITVPDSLLEYDSPIVMDEGDSMQKSIEASKTPAENGEIKAPTSRLEEILHAVLPPREFLDEKSNTRCMQYVANKQCTRIDVIKLQEMLDDKLMERQARDSGICPVREDLYTQCFDELIRQITINCPERGLLLLRVRDEIRMTTDAYKTLYQSSVAFGVRKQIESEEGMPDLLTAVEKKKAENKELEQQLADLLHKVEVIEKRGAERRQMDKKKQKEEIEFLKYQSDHLGSFFKTVSAKAGIK